jgi:hypothetical protein
VDARELEIIEVISAAGAVVNARAKRARVDLEDAEADDRIDEERWEEIRRYVFPLIERPKRRAWTRNTSACGGSVRSGHAVLDAADCGGPESHGPRTGCVRKEARAPRPAPTDQQNAALMPQARLPDDGRCL